MFRRRLLAGSAATVLIFGTHAQAVGAWQPQFSGAISWTTYGVIDDGATDNTAALNSIPGNIPVIADCPHKGAILFSGTWKWPPNLTVWQQQGCVLKSSIVTSGIYPITAIEETPNVQYYGMQFSFVTPTSQVRVLEGWLDHLKFEYFDINGSGGFAFIRGSDQEIAYGTMENTITLPGNPGIRHFGNVPEVPTSPNMHANVWIHDLVFQTGDATFQACQPLGNPSGFGYNVSSDGILYEDDYGVSSSSALILINEPLATKAGDAYTCDNVSYVNVSGSGLWDMVISPGNQNSETVGVYISNNSFNGSGHGNNLAAIGIGNITYGGNTSYGQNMSNVKLANINVTNAYKQSLWVTGAVPGISVLNSTLGAPVNPGESNYVNTNTYPVNLTGTVISP
jgi:hypothetical protein